MKKLSIFFASLVALVGFSSCEDEKSPVYQAPDPNTFEVNTPALTNQLIDLETAGTVELVVAAQPDYGYSAITQYSALLSLTPDFKETVEIASTQKTQSAMSLKANEVAIAICTLKGITDEETWDALGSTEPLPIYFKAVAELEGIPGSRVVSKNYATYQHMKYYFAVPQPAFIYVVGKFTGWTEPSESNEAHYAQYRLFEDKDAIGSNIYKGEFEIAEGEAMFRFYTELSGWDGGASVGYQEADEATDLELVDGAFECPIVAGKGSFSFTNWTGGKMQIIVDLNQMTAGFITVE